MSTELPDAALKGCEDLLGDAGLTRDLKIKLPERMPGAELTAHAGREDGKEAPPAQADRRNGVSRKVSKGQAGELPLAVPRDHDGSFAPETVKKGQTRIGGTDDKIIHYPAVDSRMEKNKAVCVAGVTRHGRREVLGRWIAENAGAKFRFAVMNEPSRRHGRGHSRLWPGHGAVAAFAPDPDTFDSGCNFAASC